VGDRGDRVIRVYVELSGEAPELGRAETIAAVRALGGAAGPDLGGPGPGLLPVDLPSREDAVRLADRVGLARRCLVRLGPMSSAVELLKVEGAQGRSASVRRIGRPTSGDRDDGIRALGRAYVEGGGRIDLERPARRFWMGTVADTGEGLFEELARVDRPAASARRMPKLPFQRPVSLPPRLARAAANLAGVRTGDRVLDPFVGTGALLAEAGLLGARVYGIDRDPDMARGALQNLFHLGVAAEAIVVGDAGAVEVGDAALTFDAVLTDPPYGRSSSTGGEGAAEVVARVLPRWAARVRPGGRIVVVMGDGSEPLGAGWRRELAVAVRVHRSLTREFRVYARSAATPTPG
jgi:tRNA (guanine10-N2)-dimethyltransferase